MDTELRNRLFANYRDTQGQTSSGSVYADIRSAWPYYEANYGVVIKDISRAAKVLEVGCGHGSLLAWLKAHGFSNLAGVDASPGDVEFANSHLGRGIVTCGGALPYLQERPEAFQLIIMKAVLEHVPKDSLLGLLEAIAAALSESGTVLIDVPNMDWLCGSHERYMDLTHEVGFTRESLDSLLKLVFGNVQIRGSSPAGLSRSQRLFRPMVIRVLRRLLYTLGEGASDVLFESRSIIATAARPAMTAERVADTHA